MTCPKKRRKSAREIADKWYRYASESGCIYIAIFRAILEGRRERRKAKR